MWFGGTGVACPLHVRYMSATCRDVSHVALPRDEKTCGFAVDIKWWRLRGSGRDPFPLEDVKGKFSMNPALSGLAECVSCRSTARETWWRCPGGRRRTCLP